MDFTFGEKNHRWLYFIGLLNIAAGLSVSKVLISIGVIWIVVNWLWEGNFAAKWRLLMARKSVLVLIVVFLLHLLGLLWTSDMNGGLRDVRIKLPLFVIPLVVGTSTPLNRKQLEGLLFVFSLGVLIASLRTFLIVKGIIVKELIDIRKASDLVSLIRLALFSALTIMFCGRWVIRNSQWYIRIACLAVTAWLLYFMVYMQSLTGIVVLFFSITLITFIMAIINKRRKALVGMLVVIAIGIGLGTRSVVRAYNDFYALRGHEVPALYDSTATGRPYEHRIDEPMYENGNKVLDNVCWVDLMLEWNKRSAYFFTSARDNKGNQIPYTLVRYLASKGLTKDSVGMSKLSDAEIREIENGSTNYREKDRDPLERRAYQVFWETYNYYGGGNPSGSSVTMRYVVVGSATHAISEHPWIGSGTGSQEKTYNDYYAQNGSELSEQWQGLHAHNQFLSIAVTLGIPAAIFFIYSLWWPARSMRRWRSYLYLAFFLIAVLSFLDDDTLETQQGVTFYAFFNALFLYAMPFVSSVTGKAAQTPAEGDPT